MNGFYLMHRGWQHNPVFGREPFSKRDAWVWMIEQAQYQERAVDIGGTTVTLARGQFCHSFRHMAETWSWSLGKVQDFVRRLTADLMINTQTHTGRLVVSVCNYNKYQYLEDDTHTPEDTASIRGAYGEHTILNQGNEVNSLAPPIVPPVAGANDGRSKRGIRLPVDWVPSPEGWQFAVDLGLDPDDVLPEFRDYWHSVPGSKGCKLDWEGTWRNRCREIGRRKTAPRGGGHRPSASGVVAALRDLDVGGNPDRRFDP